MNINGSKTRWVARVAVNCVIFAIAVLVGSRFMPTWAAYVVASVVCLVLQEIAALVSAEIKGRKAKAGA